MTPKQLKKHRQRLNEFERSPQGKTAAQLVSLATKIGRIRDNRGKEPTYVRETDPALSPPLSIPGHTGDLKIGTVLSIVAQLQSDLDEWEIHHANAKPTDSH